MTTLLSIKDLSKQIGLPAKTIRFYEEEGVISSPLREENGYRKYSALQVEELFLIKQARDLGIPLKEIKKLIKGCEGTSCEHSRDFVNGEITTYIQQLEQQINQFTELKDRLQRLQTKLASEPVDCSQGKYCCNILHQLAEDAKEVKNNE